MNENYKIINESYIKIINDSMMSEKEIKKMIQIKSFLDSSLKEVLTKNFSDDNEKISFLVQILFQTRDYLIAENIENSFKTSLLKMFNQINEKVLKEIDEDDLSIPEKKTINQ